MQPHSLNDATVAAIEKAEVAISHRPGSESVDAFDRAVQVVSDEFLVIMRAASSIGRTQAVGADSLVGCLEKIDALECHLT